VRFADVRGIAAANEVQDIPSRHHVHQESSTMLASQYPLLDIFWTMLEVFFFFIWIMLLFYVFADIFRSHDMGGGAKTLWVIFIIILPFLGVFVYVIARGGSMHERQAKAIQAQQEAMDSYVKQVAGSSNSADQLAKLAELKDKGVLSDAEFATEKAKILG
jgi:ABC-type multidrug transport system fused ATPase/permease subunit